MSQRKISYPSFFMIFFLSAFILFAFMEFRHTKNILSEYQSGIQQIIINKSNLFYENLKNVSDNVAKKIILDGSYSSQSLTSILAFDKQINNLFILSESGKVIASTSKNHVMDQKLSILENNPEHMKNLDIYFSDIYYDQEHKMDAIYTVVPISLKREPRVYVVISYNLSQFQLEILQEFITDNNKVAIFDRNRNPVFWPFTKSQIKGFDPKADVFYNEKQVYNVSSHELNQLNWKIYFLSQQNNFELYRAITILLLVFALYICLYELLVEFWGVNTAKTYFENIDFAIFNHISEGVMIANNSGTVIFANEAAHNIFIDRKPNLINVQIKDVLGRLNGFPEHGGKTTKFSIRSTDKLLDAIHSPIIKNNKILGSLTVIRANDEEVNSYNSILRKLLEVIPQGVLIIDKKHDVSMINLIAQCYVTYPLGTSIEVIDRELAIQIYQNIDTGNMKRLQLSNGMNCEITPVYDQDVIYIGTIVVLLDDIPY